MKYIVVGSGSMPLKEIPDVLNDLADPTEVVYVVTPTTRTKVGDAIVASGVFPQTTVAVVEASMVDDLPPTLAGADDIVLWNAAAELLPGSEVLAMVPAEDEPVDEFLEGVIEAALEQGLRCRAMNEQLYDIAMDGAEGSVEQPVEKSVTADPIAEQPPAQDEPVVIPPLAELEAMSRSDVKELAKKVDAKPTDWRSKKAIIEAILAKQVDDAAEEPYPVPAQAESSEEVEGAIESLEELTEKLRELEEDVSPPLPNSGPVDPPISEMAENAGPSLEEVLRSMTNVPPSEATQKAMELVRRDFKQAAKAIFEEVPPSTYRTLAIRELESSLMWTMKALALTSEEV